jgi:hypothetical protein
MPIFRIYNKKKGKVLNDESGSPASFGSEDEAIQAVNDNGLSLADFHPFDAEKADQLRTEAKQIKQTRNEVPFENPFTSADPYGAVQTDVANLVFPNATEAFSQDMSAPRKGIALGADVAMGLTAALATPLLQAKAAAIAAKRMAPEALGMIRNFATAPSRIKEKAISTGLGGLIGGSGIAAEDAIGRHATGQNISPIGTALNMALPAVGGAIAGRGNALADELIKFRAPSSVYSLIGPTPTRSRLPNAFSRNDAEELLKAGAFRGADRNYDAAETVHGEMKAIIDSKDDIRRLAGEGIQDRINFHGPATISPERELADGSVELGPMLNENIFDRAKRIELNKYNWRAEHDPIKTTKTLDKIDDILRATLDERLGKQTDLSAIEALDKRIGLSNKARIFKQVDATEEPQKEAYSTLSRALNEALMDVDKSGIIAQSTREMAYPMRVMKTLEKQLEKPSFQNTHSLVEAIDRIGRFTKFKNYVKGSTEAEINRSLPHIQKAYDKANKQIGKHAVKDKKYALIDPLKDLNRRVNRGENSMLDSTATGN